MLVRLHALLQSNCLGLAATGAPACTQVQRRSCPTCSLGSEHADGKMRHREVLPLWVLAFLGLRGTGVGLQPQRLDSFHRRVELSHPVMGETPAPWRQSFVFTPINHKCSHPPMCGSLKCFSCNFVEEPYFRRQHFEGQVGDRAKQYRQNLLHLNELTLVKFFEQELYQFVNFIANE